MIGRRQVLQQSPATRIAGSRQHARRRGGLHCDDALAASGGLPRAAPCGVPTRCVEVLLAPLAVAPFGGLELGGARGDVTWPQASNGARRVAAIQAVVKGATQVTRSRGTKVLGPGHLSSIDRRKPWFPFMSTSTQHPGRDPGVMCLSLAKKKKPEEDSALLQSGGSLKGFEVVIMILGYRGCAMQN